jgi:hypothetical protein
MPRIAGGSLHASLADRFKPTRFRRTDPPDFDPPGIPSGFSTQPRRDRRVRLTATPS